MPAKPHAIIYDFDGTIVDTLPWHLRAYRLALQEFNISAPDEEIIMKCFNIVDPVAAANFGITDVKLFSQTYRAGAREGFQQAVLTPQIISTLERLQKAGYQLCLGSLARRKDFEPALERHKLKQYFSVILTYDDCPREKPHIFKMLAEKAGIDSSKALVIGDAANDIAAAKFIGARVALYHPPVYEKYYPLVTLKPLGPDYVLRSHSEVFSYL